MRIVLKLNAKPVRVPTRRYRPLQAAFPRRKTDEIPRLGLIRRNPESRWASAPLLIPEKGLEQFRLTVDVRPVNSEAEMFSWSMPHLESAIASLAHPSCCAKIYLCPGYWKMPLAPYSLECQSFQTPNGVLTPTCAKRARKMQWFSFRALLKAWSSLFLHQSSVA